MQHILEFNDLQISSRLTENFIEASESPILASVASSLESECQSIKTSYALNSQSALFVLDESKKSSFSLSHPVALTTTSGFEDGGCIHNSNKILEKVDKCNSEGDPAYEIIPSESHPAKSDHELKVASSSISCSISDEIVDTNQSDTTTSQVNSQSHQTFLFGGFELITNARSVAVYALRVNGKNATSIGNEEEAYLTTCKGIPARDLPKLENFQSEDDGSRRNNDRGLANLWFKFIFVSPGGPKPVKFVRLKYFGDSTSAPQNIVVRLLKIKCRLPDSMPVSMDQPKTTQQFSMPSNLPDRLMNMTSERNKDNEISSMMATMSQMGIGGVNRAMTMGNSVQLDNSSMKISTKQQQRQHAQSQQISYQQPQLYPQQIFNHDHQYYLKQQQIREQQERHQAEIMSSVAGLGIFLKSSEERAKKSFESSLLAMENRILKKLDKISERLEIIEQHVLQNGEKPNDHREGEITFEDAPRRLGVIEHELQIGVERNDQFNGNGNITSGHDKLPDASFLEKG